jgi:hypothetical protein
MTRGDWPKIHVVNESLTSPLGGRSSVSDYRVREISQTEMPGISAS